MTIVCMMMEEKEKFSRSSHDNKPCDFRARYHKSQDRLNIYMGCLEDQNIVYI